MHLSGKNLCINEEGIISVIDFDIAVINNEPKSTVLKKKLEKEDDYNFKNRMIYIINNNT